MKKMSKWVVDQIRQRGGVPCMTSFYKIYKIGLFYVTVKETERWGRSSTWVMVLCKPEDETVMSCWKVSTIADKKKTKRILNALADMSLLPSCSGPDINDLLKSVKRER